MDKFSQFVIAISLFLACLLAILRKSALERQVVRHGSIDWMPRFTVGCVTATA